MADFSVELVEDILELTADPITVDVLDIADSVPYNVVVSSSVDMPLQTVINRVWDTVAGDFVRWATAEIDSGGSLYPGPGVFGVNTSDYVVETIQFTRV